MTRELTQSEQAVQAAVIWLEELIHIHNLDEKLRRDAVWVASRNMLTSANNNSLLNYQVSWHSPTGVCYIEAMGRRVFVIDTEEDYFFAPAFDFGNTMPNLTEPLPEHFILYDGELYKYQRGRVGETAYYYNVRKQVSNHPYLHRHEPAAVGAFFDGARKKIKYPSKNDTKELDEFIDSFAIKPAT